MSRRRRRATVAEVPVAGKRISVWIERTLLAVGCACIAYYGYMSLEARQFQQEQIAAFEQLLDSRTAGANAGATGGSGAAGAAGAGGLRGPGESGTAGARAIDAPAASASARAEF